MWVQVYAWMYNVDSCTHVHVYYILYNIHVHVCVCIYACMWTCICIWVCMSVCKCIYSMYQRFAYDLKYMCTCTCTWAKLAQQWLVC